MILVLSVLLATLTVGALFLLYKSIQHELTRFFLPGLLLKLAAGIALGLIYTYYYSVGDTFVFYTDAQQLVQLFQSDIMAYFHFIWEGDTSFQIAQSMANTQVRSLFMVKALSVILLGAFNNYWIASLYFSLASFLGSWYLVTKIQRYFPKGIMAAVISFIFVPSFIFWSSGVIKESLAVAALMFLAGFYVQSVNKERIKWWEWIVGLIAIYVLWSLKYYWAALFIPSALTTIIVTRVVSRLFSGFNRAYETISWFIVFLCIVLLASFIHPNFYLSRFLSVVVDNHDAYMMVSNHGPQVHFNNLQANWISILINSPWALVSGLFRPFIFECHTLLQLVISIENLLLVLLCIYNIKYLRNMVMTTHRLMVLSLVAYVILLAVFLTLSTPNFGTLSRYRVGFLPFFFFMLLYYPCQHMFERIFKLK